MKQIIINIEKYGDFDMPYTALSMLSPDGMSKSYIKRILDEAHDLFESDEDEDKVKKHLMERGFIPCSSMSLTIGGNL